LKIPKSTKLVKLTILIFLLLTAAPGDGQSPPQKQDQQRNARSNGTNHPKAVTHQPTSEESAEQVGDKYQDVRITDPVSVARDWMLVVVTVVFDALIIVFNALLWVTTRKQWEVARESLEIAQRAYVAVHDVKVAQPLFMGGQPSVSVEYRNSGKTPAYMTISVDTGFKSSFLEDIPGALGIEDFMLDQTMLLGPDVSKSEFVAEGTYLHPAPPADQELIANVRERNLYWRTWIKIRYRDVFGDTHGSIEVWVYSPERDKFEPLTLGSKVDTKKGERQEDKTIWRKFMLGLSYWPSGGWLFLSGRAK
jgi:hypothetical protein